jgi:DNA-binding NarL/FixJ family response regulator
MARVLLIEDNHLYRACLKRLIESLEGYRVVAEADSGSSAIEIVRNEPADLITLDLSLPRINGLDILREIKQWSTAKVLIITGYSNLSLIRKAETLGADGICLKDQSREAIARAIAETLEGKKPIYTTDPIPDRNRWYYRECEQTECRPPTHAQPPHRRPG